MKEHTLTKGSVGKGILLFVLPIIVGSLIQQLYVTIDAVVVGQFTGKLGLAAIDSVHTLFKFPLNFMNGLLPVRQSSFPDIAVPKMRSRCTAPSVRPARWQ